VSHVRFRQSLSQNTNDHCSSFLFAQRHDSENERPSQEAKRSETKHSIDPFADIHTTTTCNHGTYLVAVPTTYYLLHVESGEWRVDSVKSFESRGVLE
jgi:hypothetical protein